MAALNLYQNQIATLCKIYKVESLYTFGSINSADFNEPSDINLIVDINSSNPLEYTENYFELKFALEDLFQKPIDLLEDRATRNPYLKKMINDSKVLIYQA